MKVYEPEIGCDLLPQDGEWEGLDVRFELTPVERESLVGKSETEKTESTAEELVTLVDVDAQLVAGENIERLRHMLHMFCWAGTSPRTELGVG